MNSITIITITTIITIIIDTITTIITITIIIIRSNFGSSPVWARWLEQWWGGCADMAPCGGTFIEGSPCMLSVFCALMMMMMMVMVMMTMMVMVMVMVMVMISASFVL